MRVLWCDKSQFRRSRPLSLTEPFQTEPHAGIDLNLLNRENSTEVPLVPIRPDRVLSSHFGKLGINSRTDSSQFWSSMVTVNLDVCPCFAEPARNFSLLPSCGKLKAVLSILPLA